MITSSPFKPTLPGPADFGQGPLVGVVLLSLLPVPFSSLATLMFFGLLKAGLKGEGIAVKGEAGLFGPSWIVFIAQVEDHKQAVRALQTVLAHNDLASLCQIAFYDTAEEIWRGVGPRSAYLPFEQFITQERFTACAECLEREKRSWQSLQSAGFGGGADFSGTGHPQKP